MIGKVSVSKLNVKELQALQMEIEKYAACAAVNDLHKDFLNTMIIIDVARNLYLKLRTKIENPKPLQTISLSVTEASILLKCCNFDHPQKSLYSWNVMIKINLELDQKLKSMILT